jgi:succinate dehydrogenase / fumarate reductase flavoprotein subunit
LIVFGQHAGAGAADYVKKSRPAGHVRPEQAEAAVKYNSGFFERANGENPYELQREIQEMMQNLVGIMRTEAELKQSLVEIDKLGARVAKVSVGGGRTYNPGWHTAMDLKNIIAVSRAIAMAALERRESRGGHARSDYPNYDPELAKVNLIVRNENGTMQVVKQPKPQMPADLKQLVEEA